MHPEMGLELPEKQLDWDQSIEDAMRFVLSEGTVINLFSDAKDPKAKITKRTHFF